MQKGKVVVEKSRMRSCSALVLFRVVLDLAYVCIIAPVYGYSGFTVAVDALRLIESYILTLLMAIFTPHVVDRPSHFLSWMLSIGTVIPTLSYYGLHSGSRCYMYWVCLSLLIIIAISRLPSVKIPTLKQGSSIGIVVMILLTAIVTFGLIARGGLGYFNLSFGEVYQYRREVDEVMNIGPWGYLNTWVFKVVNPSLICLFLWKRKYGLVGGFTLLQILFFGISSNKGVLFYPVLIIAIYVFMQKKRTIGYLTYGVIWIVIGSSAVSLLFDYHWFSSLFIRRVFFVPARLNFVYHDLFSQIGHVYLSNSIMSALIEYPFPEPPPLMVSEFLYGHYDTWANNGFIATGYMHFGYTGMLIFALVVGMLILLADSLILGRVPMWVGVSIVVVPFFSLFTSADLPTALLTHGIIVAFLALVVMGNKRDLIYRQQQFIMAKKREKP